MAANSAYLFSKCSYASCIEKTVGTGGSAVDIVMLHFEVHQEVVLTRGRSLKATSRRQQEFFTLFLKGDTRCKLISLKPAVADNRPCSL